MTSTAMAYAAPEITTDTAVSMIGRLARSQYLTAKMMIGIQVHPSRKISRPQPMPTRNATTSSQTQAARPINPPMTRSAVVRTIKASSIRAGREF